MKFFKRFRRNPHAETPLAWAQLSHQKVRLVVATTGVCFANILMFTQLGLQAMLTEGTTRLHESLGGDLFLVSSFSPTLQWQLDFPKAYLYQAAAIDGVAEASPLYISFANWVNPKELSGEPSSDDAEDNETDLFGNQVRIIAFNPAQPVLNLPEVNQQLSRLSEPSTVLFDRLSQPSLGDVPELLAGRTDIPTVMGRRRTYVVGLFSMGSTLFEKGNVIMSDWNYAEWNGSESLDKITIGIIALKPGADITTVQAQLRASLPEEVSVFTREELIQKEQAFNNSEPNGVILRFGTIVGFIVGVIIVYQVLYADVNDHLSEYATLKAMGYADRTLLWVVLQEAVILAILGFLPGFTASLGIYQLLTVLTRIPLAMKTTVAIQVFILTLIMCSVSGAIASSKLRSADPADVF
ncbi:MAG: FtsX-like permease family protein [Cyanobacteria bacterium CRU_2_1]|nr:FtsX-like permease family protein [Cyanobacteria bacterium CRU_2_1]